MRTVRRLVLAGGGTGLVLALVTPAAGAATPAGQDVTSTSCSKQSWSTSTTGHDGYVIVNGHRYSVRGDPGTVTSKDGNSTVTRSVDPSTGRATVRVERYQPGMTDCALDATLRDALTRTLRTFGVSAPFAR